MQLRCLPLSNCYGCVDVVGPVGCQAGWLSKAYDKNDDEEVIEINLWILGRVIYMDLRWFSQASANVWVLREWGFAWGLRRVAGSAGVELLSLVLLGISRRRAAL